MKKICLVLFLITTIGFAQNTKKFPQDYFGIYKGDLEIFNAKGKQTIQMEFHLGPTKVEGKYQYTLVYIMNGNRQERKYNIIEKDVEKGQYIIDENNDIVLQAQWMNSALYSMYEVQDNILTTTERFYDDRMVFEITVTNRKNQQKSGGTSEEIPEVIAYPINVVQHAVLMKE